MQIMIFGCRENARLFRQTNGNDPIAIARAKLNKKWNLLETLMRISKKISFRIHIIIACPISKINSQSGGKGVLFSATDWSIHLLKVFLSTPRSFEAVRAEIVPLSHLVKTLKKLSGLRFGLRPK